MPTSRLVCKFPSKPVFMAGPESTPDLPILSAVMDDAVTEVADRGEKKAPEPVGSGLSVCVGGEGRI